MSGIVRPLGQFELFRPTQPHDHNRTRDRVERRISADFRPGLLRPRPKNFATILLKSGSPPDACGDGYLPWGAAPELKDGASLGLLFPARSARRSNDDAVPPLVLGLVERTVCGFEGIASAGKGKHLGQSGGERD